MNDESTKKSALKNGSKLRNSSTAQKAAGEKFRSGRKDNDLTREERIELARSRRQGRAMAYKEAAAKRKAKKEAAGRYNRLVVAEEFIRRSLPARGDKDSEDGNVGIESLDAGLSIVGTASGKLQSELYAKKRYEKKHEAQVKQENTTKKTGSNPQSRARQHSQMKKEIKEQTFRKSKKDAANQAGNIGKKFVDQAEDLMGRLGEYVAEHPKELLTLGLILILVLLIAGTFSSCGVVMNGMSHVGITTSYTADDEDILDVDEDYHEMEEDLQDTIDNVERDCPDYDEYQYFLDNIGHNSYRLAAVLTVLYEQYTESVVQDMLEEIFDRQYELEFEEEIEEKTREVTKTGTRWVDDEGYEDGGYYEDYTYTEEETYDYYILKVYLTNNTLDTVIRSLGLTEDQMARYEVLLETYGNKKYLFDDNIYSIVDPGRYGDYDIPPEALTDTRFANMIREAEKYLGYPYVWGGSSPSTSFDCSGFVSWVINHCGNGWNVGRQTANGLLNCCTRISESQARPGDLIFFKGTYDVKGASHVGIYVGDGMMLHCGSPIQYTSVNTNYWKKHYYTYGRING